METREIAFKNLPFTPVKGQVIYVEPKYNVKLNNFIQENYKWVKDEFKRYGYDFCYLPLLIKEVISYNAPYVNSEKHKVYASNIPSLADYVINGEIKTPMLVFVLDREVNDPDGNVVFQCVPIKTKWYLSTYNIFIRLAKTVDNTNYEKCLYYHIKRTEKREIKVCCDNAPDDVEPETDTSFAKKIYDRSISVENVEAQVCFSLKEDADTTFDGESQKLIYEIRERISALKNLGVNTMLLHDIIDEEEVISDIHITDDYRIFLPDYGNIEIFMPALVKAVFFLFLNHEEGIRFKDLSDYRNELMNIYMQLNPRGDDEKHEMTIQEVTNPYGNSINEKCARIREAFIRKIDDRLAKNYYVTGKRGEPKCITLDRSKVVWVD